jgi:light-regulated signal transduction histidine kinase (bacteriophytochrome)
MIACHHSAPRHVPHGVRMVCEVVGQMVSVSIASLETARMAKRLAQTSTSLAQLGVRARAADDLLTGLASGLPNPQDLVESDVTLCLWGGRAAFCKGRLCAATVKRLAEILDAQNDEMITTSRIGDTFGDVGDAFAPYYGIHAVCFDVGRRGWVVWLRLEQIDNVRWAGRPIKEVRIGPNGPRLTPRGSFREWREEVRGASIPWVASDIGTAEALRAELSRISGMHAIEMEKARHQLLAALGHDLREPLHSIALAAQVLKARGEDDISGRISKTSGRMTRLITQILDMSLLQSDGGIILNRTSFDLSTLLREAVEDANFSYAGSYVTVEAPEVLVIDADRDRLTQVLSNLLSNARHHGAPGQAVMVFAVEHADALVFGVKNAGAPIPSSAQANIFKAFKPNASVNPRNPTGLGLGLYIAYEIVKAHGGNLSLECANNQITFRATLPRVQ